FIVLASFTFVLSYLYGSPFLYGTQYIPIAATSAISALSIGAGLVTALGAQAIPARYMTGNTTRARLLRSFVPLVIGVILIQNIAFNALSFFFSIDNALFLSLSLVIFTVLTVGIIARSSSELGSALDRSEAALVRKNEDLNALNEELTATQEELQQNLNELIRAQQEIQKSEEKFRTVADFTSDWEYWQGPDGAFQYISPSCRDITGYSPQEFVDRPDLLMDILHPDDRTLFMDHQKICQNSPDPLHIDYRILRKDGNERWISHNCRPVFSAVHISLGRRVSNRDITGRKKAEEGLLQKNEELGAINEELTSVQEELRQNYDELSKAEHALQETSQYLENLIGYANAPIIVWDPQFRIIRFNHAFERLTGRTANDVIGWPLEVLFPKKSRQESMQRIMKTATGERWEVVEIPILHVSGDIRMVLWNSATLYRDDGKTVLSTIAQGQDITDRKIAEDKNLRAREEWERTFDTVPDLIAILDTQHRILRVNRPMAERLNKTVEECVGRHCYEAVHGTSIPPEFCPHAETCRDGKQHILEVHEPALGGYFIVSTTPMYGSDGQLIGTVHVAHDITESKRIEDELRKTVTELQRSNQDLEQFAYVASHDLQEPLRNVTLFSQLFIRKYGDTIDGEGKEYLDFVIEGSTRMSTLIHDLLDFSRVTTRGEPFIPVDMNDAVDDSCTNLQALIQESGSSVTYDSLPVVKADPLQIRQVFQNLIDNAIKYRGTDPSRVHISAARKDNEWVFSVSDNGIGIAPEYHEKIFQLFKRLHTRQKYSGTGIGLALVKKIVERHCGKIWVDSEEGKGATFRFTLPAI
ncbi:MAG: PAS domain S-box protein, partial [Methanomicrobiales archaeon]|nr:PAS domain S-box protein [Methanomicrobiales archaeon]